MLPELFLQELGVLLVSSVMIICGILSSRDLIRPALNKIFSITRCPKVSLFLSLITLGCLPIHGRLISVSPLISPLTQDKRGKEKLGILSYLCTHHFYLWSPLEKSVLIVLGFFGIGLAKFLSLMIVPLIVTLLFILGVFFYYVKDMEFSLDLAPVPKRGFTELLILGFVISVCFLRLWPGYDLVISLFLYCLYLIFRYKVGWREVLSYLKPTPILVLALSVFLGWYLGAYEPLLQAKLSHLASPYAVSALVFFGSLLLGSSAKYSGLTVMATSILGIQYLPLLYVSGFCGYLLSPAHQCVALGKMYFGTTYREYYSVLTALSLLLMASVLFF